MEVAQVKYYIEADSELKAYLMKSFKRSKTNEQTAIEAFRNMFIELMQHGLDMPLELEV